MATNEIKHLRQRQTRRVMPCIGPLLDSWEQVPNDVKSNPELEWFREHMEKLNQAMED